MKFNLFNKRPKDIPAVSVSPKTDLTNYSNNDSDFSFVFNDQSGTDIPCQGITVAGSGKSDHLNTLTIYRNGEVLKKLGLTYKYRVSEKSEAVKFKRFAAIGISGYFYLYDLSDESVKIFIDFGGYFCGFKTVDRYLFVAYHSGVYCITEYGFIKWHNASIGIDGVILYDIKDGKLHGSRQLDPPDGWKDFILDIESGQLL